MSIWAWLELYFYLLTMCPGTTHFVGWWLSLQLSTPNFLVGKHSFILWILSSTFRFIDLFRANLNSKDWFVTKKFDLSRDPAHRAGSQQEFPSPESNQAMSNLRANVSRISRQMRWEFGTKKALEMSRIETKDLTFQINLRWTTI